MLVAIGEQAKHLDRLNALDLSVNFPDVDWRGVKGVRDILSHHSFDIDAGIIFDICRNEIVPLKLAIERLAVIYADVD